VVDSDGLQPTIASTQLRNTSQQDRGRMAGRVTQERRWTSRVDGGRVPFRPLRRGGRVVEGAGLEFQLHLHGCTWVRIPPSPPENRKRPARGVLRFRARGWAENPRDVGGTNRSAHGTCLWHRGGLRTHGTWGRQIAAICTSQRQRRGRPSGARPMRGPSESHPLRQKTVNAPQGAFCVFGPGGGLRTHTWGRQIALRFARPSQRQRAGAPAGRGPCVGRVNPTLSARKP
jgi:hypothetical protein